MLRPRSHPSRAIGYWRLALALALVVALFGVLAPTSLAGDPAPVGAVPPESADKFCVEGFVIDHEENPEDGEWIIEATPRDAQGNLDQGASLFTVSAPDDDDDDFETGEFKFEDDLYPGTWRFSIKLKNGWEAVTPAEFDVPLKYGMDACVQIRFKVRQVVEVIVIKIDDNHVPLEGWTIRAEPGPKNLFAEAKEEETDAEGKATFYLTPGLWYFSEIPPDKDDRDWTSYDPIIPWDGWQQLEIDPGDNPGPITIRFKNRLEELGCIEVYKFDVPPAGDEPFGLADWNIYVERANGTLAAHGLTSATGYVKFTDLPLGPYTVIEETRPGWEPMTPTSFDVTLTGYQCEVITFHNRQEKPYFCIEGRKLDVNGYVGLPGWEISAEPLEAGGYDPDNVFTNGLGDFKFYLPANDYRVPGSQYRICEELEDVEGWLPHTATCRTVTVPYEPGICAVVPDFVNQQVGHSDVVRPDPHPQPTGCRAIHYVQKGEGLFSIGNKYSISAQHMIDANPWVRGQKNWYVYVGQALCIPY